LPLSRPGPSGRPPPLRETMSPAPTAVCQKMVLPLLIPLPFPTRRIRMLPPPLPPLSLVNPHLRCNGPPRLPPRPLFVPRLIFGTVFSARPKQTFHHPPSSWFHGPPLGGKVWFAFLLGKGTSPLREARFSASDLKYSPFFIASRFSKGTYLAQHFEPSLTRRVPFLSFAPCGPFPLEHVFY